MGSDTEVEKKKAPTALAPIAKPLAGKKLCKRTLKLVRRASEAKLCVIAGNISPIDVITHVPILCEEANIPYIYVPSKEDLATAGTTKRPTCCVLVMTKPAKGEINEEVKEKLKSDYDHIVAEVAEVTSSILATEVQPCGHRCSDASEFRAGRTSQSAREPASDSGSNSGFGIGSDPSGISSDGEIWPPLFGILWQIQDKAHREGSATIPSLVIPCKTCSTMLVNTPTNMICTP
uniref:Ribosomal protein eL8/eL30/eS12/Gadd45 domain-containing protein n=1 Tax=Oryza nivara TaxID=4536 RepID=A0A0E0GCM9_ORYNI